MKKLSPTVYFLSAVIVVMGIFFVTALGYTEPKVGLMPLLMSGATIGLSVIAIVQDLRAGSRHSAPTDDDGDVVEDEQKRGTPLSAYFKYFGWFLGLIATVYCFGFILGTPVWMAAYLWRHHSRWWAAAIMGLVTIAILYAAFTLVLKVELYPGVVFTFLKHLGR